jgi:hypothetical protein
VLFDLVPLVPHSNHSQRRNHLHGWKIGCACREGYHKKSHARGWLLEAPRSHGKCHLRPFFLSFHALPTPHVLNSRRRRDNKSISLSEAQVHGDS